jgi:hypothetical protein
MGNTIKIKRQDTYKRNIKFESKGELQDATGYTFYFTVRESIPATSVVNDNDAKISKEIAGNSTGIMALELGPSDTDIDPKEYVYEIQYKKPNGDLHSSETAKFVIEADITRSGAS